MITVVMRVRHRKHKTIKRRVRTWTEALSVIKAEASTTMIAVAFDGKGSLRAYTWLRYGAWGAHWRRMH